MKRSVHFFAFPSHRIFLALLAAGAALPFSACSKSECDTSRDCFSSSEDGGLTMTIEGEGEGDSLGGHGGVEAESGGDGGSKMMGDGDGDDEVEELICEASELACGATCVNPLTNAKYCGAEADCRAENAGSTCDSNEVCEEGLCVFACVDVAGKCLRWQPIEQGVTHSGEPGIPQIAVNQSGVGVAVWATPSEVRGHRILTPGDDWSADFTVAASGLPIASASVGIDDKGKETFAWIETTAKRSILTAKSFAAESHLASSAKSIDWNEGTSGSSSSSAFKASPLGTAYAAWLQPGYGYTSSIWFSEMNGMTNAWSSPPQGNGVLLAPYPERLVMDLDATDQATMLWQRESGATKSLMTARPTSGAFGSSFSLVDDSSAFVDYDLSVGAVGDVVVAWIQAGSVKMRRRTASTWNSPQEVADKALGAAIEVEVDMDPLGNIALGWRRQGAEAEVIGATYFVAKDQTWKTAQFEEEFEGDATELEVATDGEGNAFIVWGQQSGDRTSAFAVRFDSESGWGEPQLIERNDDADVSGLSLAVTPSGYAFVVGRLVSSTGKNTLFANTFR